MSEPGGVVRIRYFASARDAAGRSSQAAPAGQSLAATLDRLVKDRGDDFARALATATFLVDGARRPLSDDGPLPAGSTVDVLPPFAGG
ncbi:MAG: MoaD/ThiS family protein [Propionibacteriaceae bacterium]|jgi:molybdopterin converting factor small subunit|nr:MoaD/ThiS family protein [Propionibacteriaceae bacterium]